MTFRDVLNAGRGAPRDLCMRAGRWFVPVLAALAMTVVSLPAAEESVPAAEGRIRGTVRTSEGRPGAGMLVLLLSHAETGALRVTSTDEKGNYQFRELPPGMYEVRVEAAGAATEIKKDIEVRPPFQNIVDIRLRPAGAGDGGAGSPAGSSTRAGGGVVPVQGQLLERGGGPVVEAIVLLAPLVGDGLWQALSDGGGAFRIEGVPPGAYRLSVRSLGHVPIELGRVEVPAESGLSLRLVLVGYPLSFITEAGVRPVPEQPRPWVPAQMAPAPEPEPDPLVPGPPEEASTAPPES